jgi:glycosyltransferase involved in cell wall biosynthesis
MPRLSICIPTYCQLDFLRETLLSVKVQDFEDYELIISDDSPDNSVARLVESFDFGGRLHYYKNLNALGSPENWNEAIRHARGDYIKLLHHDDRLAHPAALSSFVRMLDEHPEVDFAFSASLVEDVSKKSYLIHRPTDDQLVRLLATPESLFFGNVIGAPSATIYRNGLCLEYDRRMKWLVDIDFYIRLLQRNNKFIYSDDALIATPTNVVHQVTEVCKNNPKIELSEYLLLYCKISSRIDDDPATTRTWFRLFEKYKVYTRSDMDKVLRDISFSTGILDSLFDLYQKRSMSRFLYRLYSRVPESVKKIIHRARRSA